VTAPPLMIAVVVRDGLPATEEAEKLPDTERCDEEAKPAAAVDPV